MSEPEKCSDCGSTDILFDHERSELICQHCGIVVGFADFAPPPERALTGEMYNSLAYTSLAVGTEIENSQRTELKVAFDIKRLINQLDLPQSLEPYAISYVRRLRQAMKIQNNKKIRLTRTELTVIAIWNSIKLTNYPLTADEYLTKVQTIYKVKNLMKIEKRTSPFIKNATRIPDVTLVVSHINKISAQLETQQIIDNYYAGKVRMYAIQLVLANPCVAKNRRANMVAAAALFASDSLLADILSLKVVAQVANTGTGSVSGLAQVFRRNAPPLELETVAVRFAEYLLEGLRP